MTKDTVSDLLINILTDAGVTHMFGIPGDAINHLTEAIRNQDKIEYIQVRHEEAGAFAAGAQAKLTGNLGVCMGTAGPGAIHLLNGLYDAKMDHAPVLAITGHVPRKYIGTGYHQEVDLYSLFKDVAVFNQVVMTPEQLPHLVVQACQAALSHKGVAHLSIPVDVAGLKLSKNRTRSPIAKEHSETLPCEGDLEAAAKLLNGSEKIAILAGIGCRGAERELVCLAEQLGAPIIRALRGKEILPDDHSLAIGGLGMLGVEPAVKAVEQCDLLLMAGTDFPYDDFFPKDTPAIQIDIDPTRLGRRNSIEIGLNGHARPTLEALTARLTTKENRDYLKSAQKNMSDWREKQAVIETGSETPIRPQRLARSIGDLARDDAIFICDTGTVTAWAARHLHIRQGQRFTLSSSLASMAFGLPGAIGAQLAYPDRQVIALCGDGGFAMLMADFVTAVKYELPITVIVFNNSKLGLIQFEQEAVGLPDYQTALHNPDFAKFAEICGGEGFAVSEPDQLDHAIKQAYDSTKPSIIDVKIHDSELIMPPKIKLSQAMNFGIAKVKEVLSGHPEKLIP